MALQDCIVVGLENVDPSMLVTAVSISGVTLIAPGGSKVPALYGTFSAIPNPYITSLRFQFGPTDLSTGLSESMARPDALSWGDSRVVAGKSYSVRFRAEGDGIVGPWSTPVTVTVPADFIAGQIVNQGDLAVTNRASLPFGTNLLVNSDLTRTANGWWDAAFSNIPGRATAMARNFNNGTSFSGARNSLVVYASFPPIPSTGGPYYLYGTIPRGANGGLSELRSFGIPCQGGDRIYVRAGVATYDFDDLALTVAFWDANNVSLGSTTVYPPGWVDARLGGRTGVNGDPANYYVVSNFVNVPAGASWASFALSGHIGTGKTSAFMFMIEPMMSKVPAGQTAEFAYVTGYPDRAADYTNENIAAGFTGQGPFAVYTGLTPTDMSAKIQRLNVNGRMINTLVGSNGIITGDTFSRSPYYVLGSVTGSGSATISVAAHSFYGQGISVSFSAGSVTGLAYNTLYFVYAYDPGLSGGGVTYVASTNQTTYGTNPDYLFVDQITTVTSGGSTGTPPTPPVPPGGQPTCVSVDAWLPCYKRAGDAEVGTPMLMLDEDGNGMHASQIKGYAQDVASGMRLRTSSGVTLTLSSKTPVVVRNEAGEQKQKFSWELLENEDWVAVLDAEGFRWEPLVDVVHTCTMLVAHIFVDDGVYAAGDQRGRYIFTHNRKPLDNF